MTERTVVAIGSSKSRDYSFLTPLTCLLWREVVGFQPIALLVGERDEWLSERETRAAAEAMETLGIDHRFTGRAAGYEDGTIAQSVRQHAAALSEFADDVWLMMGDADLWPLRRDCYRSHVDRTDIKIKAACYYANGDGFVSKEDVLARYDAGLPFQSIPTCHVAMRAAEWRDVYALRAGESVLDATKRTLDRHWESFMSKFAGPDRNLAVWCADQWLMTERLCRQGWFPQEVLFVHRRGGPPVDRLDRGHRGDWGAQFAAGRWADAHLLKAPDAPGNWQDILPIIDALLPGHSAWAREYHQRHAS